MQHEHKRTYGGNWGWWCVYRNKKIQRWTEIQSLPPQCTIGIFGISLDDGLFSHFHELHTEIHSLKTVLRYQHTWWDIVSLIVAKILSVPVTSLPTHLQTVTPIHENTILTWMTSPSPSVKQSSGCSATSSPSFVHVLRWIFTFCPFCGLLSQPSPASRTFFFSRSLPGHGDKDIISNEYQPPDWCLCFLPT